MAIVYIVPRRDQYTTEDGDFFNFRMSRLAGGDPNLSDDCRLVVYTGFDKDLTRLPLSKLRLLAQKVKVRGRSKMRKAELLAAVTKLIHFD